MSKKKQEKTADAYYVVPKFAGLAGVSKQAVYGRIRRGGLAGYIKKEGGQTVVSEEALALYGVKTDSKDGKDDSKDDDKGENQAESRESRDIKDESINNQEKMGELIDSLYGMKENKAESKADQAECKACSQGKSRESSAFLDYLIQENTRLLAEIEKKERIIAEKDAVITGYADQFAEFARREQEISAKALNTTGQAQLLHAMSSEQAEVIEAEAETIEETPEAPSKWVPWWKRKK